MRFLSPDHHFPDRPQLLATVGPASGPLVREMALAGATAFRLNASHLSAPALDAALATVRTACPDAPVVVDLQGAKMRLGLFGPRPVAAGELVRFVLDGPDGIPLPHPELFVQARPGETLSVDDGRVRFEIVRVSADSLTGVPVRDAVLHPRKGVNVEQHPVVCTGLSDADREACRMAALHGVRAFAFSFMSTGAEAAWVREAVPGCMVAGKIERAEAADRVETIAAAVDALWICRGDLGAQLGMRRLARFVAGVDPGRLAKPVLMAGQVLEHLTEHAEPTRSEVCHLHDLLSRGYAGIVLSDETAIGRDPVGAVATAATLLAGLRADT